MDDNAFQEDQRIVQEIAGRFGAPSFMRRARNVETTWLLLLESLHLDRKEMLEIVRLRLGQMLVLAGGWDIYRTLIPEDEDLILLQSLHEDLQPRLRMPLEATTSRRVLRGALWELLDAMEAFNRRWLKLLQKIDLRNVNAAREAYNKYYLVEKECALGSARIARMGYHHLEMITLDDLLKNFPRLRLPRLQK